MHRTAPARRLVLTAGAAAIALLAVAGCTSDPSTVAAPVPPAGAGPAADATGTGPATSPAGNPAGDGAGPAPVTPTRPATPPPSVEDVATPVAIPPGVMLHPTDWPGGRVRSSSTGIAALPQTEPSACQARTAFPSDRYRRAARSIGISSDEPESGGVAQQIVRYAPGRAGQALTEMRRVLIACRAGYPVPKVSPGTIRTYRLEAEHFAGDDALLVRLADREPAGRVWGDYISVVRIGDALVVTTSELGEGVADATVASRLAAAGARRAACLRDGC